MTDIAERLRKDADGWEKNRQTIGGPPIDALIEIEREAAAEIERLRAGLDAAIRAAKLALFVIHKQGVMPNSSWEGGFKDDLATAEAARAFEQSLPAKEG
jgi:hypothetical protein